MRRDLAGHAGLAALPTAHSFQSISRGDMGLVQPRPGKLLGQLHISFNDRCLGGPLHSAQAQAEGGRPLIHGAMLRHARIFGVLDHGQVDLGRQA